MVKEGSLLVQTALASSITNLYSQDRDEFSATARTLGWTEVWGDEAGLVDANAEYWNDEEEQVTYLTASSLSEASRLLPDISVTLVQFRPAWLEQLVLRIANIPHIVINSPYASTESTGPLPYLKDNFKDQPILVGRNHPGMRLRKEVVEDGGIGFTSEQMTHKPERHTNCILDYLQSQRGLDLDAPLKQGSGNNKKQNSQQSLADLLTLLVTTKLEKSLVVLRYEDEDAWGQVYRKQCLQSSRNAEAENSESSEQSSEKNNSWRLPTMRGLFQAWSERAIARKALRFGGPCLSVKEARLEARKAYEILEHQLEQRSQENHYLLNTTKPVMVDVILWAHLADALCDINLVTVLADFPLLVKYFQRMYDVYFATSGTVVMIGSKDPDTWKVWNKHENHANAFQQIPLESEMNKSKDVPKKYTHALELMQNLSVRDHDLLETLKVGNAARANEAMLVSRRSGASKNLSSTPKSKPKDEEEKSELTAIEKVRRQQQRSDQIWISVVGGAAAAAMTYSVVSQLG